MTDCELAREIMDEIQKEHQEPVIQFRLEPGGPGLLESKVGGTPYLPREMDWPLDRVGVPMILLAQVNCGELASLPDFPDKGLLQFFIAYNDVYGLNFDDMTVPGGFQVLYHESVDPSITEAEVQAKQPIRQEDDGWEYNTPLLGKIPCRICFGRAGMQGMTMGDYRFEGLFIQKWNQKHPEAPIEALWDIDLTGLTEDGGIYHQLGGYPYFTQTDPRWGGKYPDLDLLLFQLDSQLREDKDSPDLVLWGDCGVGNFFISRGALRRRDFSRVGYSWDCC